MNCVGLAIVCLQRWAKVSVSRRRPWPRVKRIILVTSCLGPSVHQRRCGTRLSMCQSMELCWDLCRLVSHTYAWGENCWHPHCANIYMNETVRPLYKELAAWCWCQVKMGTSNFGDTRSAYRLAWPYCCMQSKLILMLLIRIHFARSVRLTIPRLDVLLVLFPDCSAYVRV